MTKQYLLFAGKEIDTDAQTVSVNQIVQLEGYSYSKYVVYEIKKDQWGVHYKLINLRDYSFHTSDLIQPLSEKFGIGIYYDDKNPTFKTNEEVAELFAKAQAKHVDKMEVQRAEEKRREEIRVIGREWLTNNLPEDTKAVIIACLKQNESDSQTDYYGASTVRTVILGFSKHTRDIFSEMRKCASNFEETAHLSEHNEAYENREKYSMGKGYYLGESYYSGWIIKKEPIGNKEQAIQHFSYIAGCPDAIHIKANRQNNQSETADTTENEQTAMQIESDNLSFEIVDYSEKAIALFGDTRAIKDLLKAMGGKFNPRLTHKDEKQAGWIFAPSQRAELEIVLNLNK